MVKDIYIDETSDRTIIVVLNIDRGFDIPQCNRHDHQPDFYGRPRHGCVFNNPCEGDGCAQSGEYLKGDARSLPGRHDRPGELDMYTERLRKGLAINMDSLAHANPSLAGSLVALDNSLKNIELLTGKIQPSARRHRSSLTLTVESAAGFAISSTPTRTRSATS